MSVRKLMEKRTTTGTVQRQISSAQASRVRR